MRKRLSNADRLGNELVRAAFFLCSLFFSQSSGVYIRYRDEALPEEEKEEF